MSFFADRVRDTTTTTGTGALTLNGTPPTGLRSFASGFAVGDLVYYAIEGGAEWEVGLGTLTAATTLARTTVYASSNAGAAVNLSAGTKNVFSTAPATFLDRLPAFLEGGHRRSPLLRSDFMTAQAFQGDGFVLTAISTGTFTTTPAAAALVGNHPGVCLLRSSTTANSGVYCHTAIHMLRLAGGEQFDLVFFTPAALTANTYRFGFHDTLTSTDAVDGIYFEMPATGAIVGKTSNNSVRTTSATIATLVASTWYHARIVVNAAATGVDFFVFSDAGAQLGTVNIATNIPTASGREVGPGGTFTNSGTTAVDIVTLDYMSFNVPGRILQRGAL